MLSQCLLCERFCRWDGRVELWASSPRLGRKMRVIIEAVVGKGVDMMVDGTLEMAAEGLGRGRVVLMSRVLWELSESQTSQSPVRANPISLRKPIRCSR